MTRRSHKRLVWLLLPGLLVFSCATAPKQELISLQWPESPLPPRVVFLQTLGSDRDLGRVPTWGERIIEFLTGKRPPSWHLFQPMDLVVSDDARRVYVSDYGQSHVFVFDLDRKRVERWGPFDRPFGLALDGEENLYVAEQASAAILILDREGHTLRVIRHPDLIRPADLVMDRARGRLYVADPSRREAERHTVKVFDLAGNLVDQIGEGKGEEPGQLYFPTYLGLDAASNLYVSNTMNARLDVFSPQGTYLRSVGERGNVVGMFDKPKGVALDRFGNIYVVDSSWSNVQIFNQQGEVLLFFGGRGSYPGLLKNPTGIAIDHDRIYVADLLNSRIAIYQMLNPEGKGSLELDSPGAEIRGTGS